MRSLLLASILVLSTTARAEIPFELNHSTNYLPKPHSIRVLTLGDRESVEVTIDRNACVYDENGIPSCTAMAIETLVVSPRTIGLDFWELTPRILLERVFDPVKGTYDLILKTDELSEGEDIEELPGWKRLRLYPQG